MSLFIKLSITIYFLTPHTRKHKDRRQRRSETDKGGPPPAAKMLPTCDVHPPNALYMTSSVYQAFSDVTPPRRAYTPSKLRVRGSRVATLRSQLDKQHAASMMSFALRTVAGMALASTASGMAMASRSTGGLRALSTLRGGASGKEVLVTGGVGYIGSHTVLELLRADYRVVIVDNLCNSNLECLKRVQELAGKEATFYEADIRDKSAMA